MQRIKNGIERTVNGIISVCTVGALMGGAALAAILVFAQGIGWGIAFGALFTAVFVLGVMKRD
jgi:hypothetical protein